MSSRIIKIDANQGSFDTTGSKSNVDIDIPGGIGNINLSESGVLVTVRPAYNITNDIAGSVGNAYVSYALEDGQDLSIYNTAALVRNVNFSSQNKGRIEDIRHVDILKNTLSVYQNDLAQVQAGSNKLATLEFGVQTSAQQTMEISKVSDIVSRAVDHDIFIPLKNILNIGKSDGFDTAAHANSRLHLEFNFDKLSASRPSSIVAATKIPGDSTTVHSGFASITLPAGAATASQTVFTSTNAYKNDSDSPWFVGQAVSLSSKNDTAGAAVVQSKIVKVEFTEARKVTLTLNPGSSDLVAEKTLSEITIVENPLTVSGQSVAIGKVQLVATLSDEPAPKQINYTTFISEEDTYPATTNCSRMYTVPPACKNVYIMFFGDATNNKMLSAGANLDSYRLTLDNRDLTPRPIKMGGMVHRDLIASVYSNNGEALKNIRETQIANEASFDPGTLNGSPNRMIAVPIPFKSTQSLLQVELVGSGNLSGHHIVYYEVQKQV